MTTQTMKRPQVTAELIHKAAMKVGAKLADRPHEVDSVVDSICREYSYPMDGFELAKRLDKWESWDTTRDDMEILDELDTHVREAIDEEEKKWFAEFPMEPPLPIGAKTTKGTIDHIYEYGPARYCIKAHGCAQDGRFLIVKFEDAREEE
jgi:hypothetical protein